MSDDGTVFEGRSDDGRPFDTEDAGGFKRRETRAPSVAIAEPLPGAIGSNQEGLAVVVIADFVAMSVKRPRQVFFEPVRMSVIGNHFQMILDRLDNLRRMRDGWDNRPDNNRQAE